MGAGDVGGVAEGLGSAPEVREESAHPSRGSGGAQWSPLWGEFPVSD